MSKSVKEELKDFTTKPIEEIAHPMYDNFGIKTSPIEAREYLNLPLDSKIILFFGFIRNYKGLDLALEAMAQETIKARNYHLLIAGEFYESDAPYLEFIKKNNLKNILLHTHFIKDEDVKYYFSAADVILQPYKTATQSGISQIAYHFETPMIVTNVGGLPEIVPHLKSGFITEPNGTSISNAILQYFDGNYQELLLPTLQQEKQKYTWKTFIEKYIHFYHKIYKKN